MLKRTFFTKKKLSLKRSFIKKKPKPVDEEAIKRMREFFLAIWRNRVHLCSVCGASLGGEPRTYHFHHVIAKQRQRDYTIDITYDEKNIVLVCLDCHANIENGFLPPDLREKKTELTEYYDQYRDV